jgi:MerR family transcriptional regulator, thiopeptide resistance regulator
MTRWGYARSTASYRLYSTEDLLRSQQILFFLEECIARMQRLVTTIDRILLRLKGGSVELTDEELYEGFTEEQAERYQREAAERYDPALMAESNRRIRKMSKAQWQTLKAQGNAVTQAIADAMSVDQRIADQRIVDPRDPKVQALVAEHFAWIGNFYTVTSQIYCGLALLYVENDEFRASYERIAPGLADFLSEAMIHYADTVLDA